MSRAAGPQKGAFGSSTPIPLGGWRGVRRTGVHGFGRRWLGGFLESAVKYLHSAFRLYVTAPALAPVLSVLRVSGRNLPGVQTDRLMAYSLRVLIHHHTGDAW